MCGGLQRSCQRYTLISAPAVRTLLQALPHHIREITARLHQGRLSELSRQLLRPALELGVGTAPRAEMRHIQHARKPGWALSTAPPLEDRKTGRCTAPPRGSARTYAAPTSVREPNHSARSRANPDAERTRELVGPGDRRGYPRWNPPADEHARGSLTAKKRLTDYTAFVSARVRALSPSGRAEARAAMRQVAAEWRAMQGR